MRTHRSSFIGSLAALLVATSVHAQQLVEVNTCGQVVPRKAIGYLAADLDCTGFTGGPSNAYDAGAAVSLEAGSALDLRGFTLTTGDYGVLCNNLKCGERACAGKTPCEVFGGTITGSGFRCIGGVKPIVRDVTITGCYYAIYGYDKVSVSNSTITASAHSGVFSGRTKIVDSTITDHAYYGVQAQNTNSARASIVGSTVTGNGTVGACAGDPSACGDVYSERRPRLSSTTCDTSVAPSGTWGVCALD